MERLMSKILENYEQGKISRRQLMAGLTAIIAATHSVPVFGSTFRGIAINHIALRVTNVQRSRDFYQKHLGAPVLRESQNDCFLGLGKNFLTLFRNQNPGLDHYCLAIENYRADQVVEELNRQGLTPTRPSGSDRVYFPDPDGITVQLSSIDHQP